MISYRTFSAAAVLLLVAACDDDGSMMSGEHSGPAMNYHVINERVATGGHFVGDGLQQLAGQGLEVVIDLRDQPPEGQREKLAADGIKWISVPVSWERPQPQDFERFKAVMQEHQSANVLVQCAANYRASAMTYLYRVTVDGVDETIAKKELNAVWELNDTWSDYANTVLSAKALR